MHDQYFAIAISKRDDSRPIVAICRECQHEPMAIGSARMMWQTPGIVAAVAFRRSVAFDGFVSGETLHSFGSVPEAIGIDLSEYEGEE